MIDVAGFVAPWGVYALVLALHLVLPGQKVRGYVCDAETGVPLVYRINGALVLVVIVSAWVMACSRGVLAWDWLWTHRWAGLAGACTAGLVFSIAIVGRAPSTGRSTLADFYFGRLDNPRVLGRSVDLKMLLYLCGAVMLQLNVLSFAAHGGSVGVFVHAAMLTFFVWDYLFFERVHLYTYDLFAEKVGFKLGWGCLVFYPYFYAVGLWATADGSDPGTSGGLLVVSIAIFLGGWCLARGANLQKFMFKIDPTHRFLGLIEPNVVGDGERTLLCSGFWGVSRHVNYLGEILMATGLALVLANHGSPLPWLYPLYYVALLVPRERADHRRCAQKYGPLWDEYCRRVPRRIVPGIY